MRYILLRAQRPVFLKHALDVLEDLVDFVVLADESGHRVLQAELVSLRVESTPEVAFVELRAHLK